MSKKPKRKRAGAAASAPGTKTAADGAGGASASEVTAPPASVPPATSKPAKGGNQAKATKATQDYLVVTAKYDRRRAGVSFPKGETRLPVADITLDQEKKIKADPELTVHRVVA